MIKLDKLFPVLGGMLFMVNSSAFASGYDCEFTTSCYGELGCKPKSLRIQAVDLDDQSAEIVTPGVTVRAIKQVDKGAGLVSGTVAYTSVMKNDTMHLLTIYPNESSLFSSHAYSNDAIFVQSRGRCTAN